MYKLVKKYIQKVDKTEIVFYELKIDDVKEALCETYKIISNDSWVQKLTDEALKQSYSSRLDKTVNQLYALFKVNQELNKSTGEYIVSVTSKKVLTDELQYLDIPLGEVIGKRIVGNGGFDYYGENGVKNYIIFGEAKYIKDKSAYAKALDQVVDFIVNKKDIDDYADISNFVSDKSGNNFANGIKGYSAGFTFYGNGKTLIDKIIKEYNELLKYNELVLIGVCFVK